MGISAKKARPANSAINEIPGPEVEVIARAPAHPAPTAIPIAASSSSAVKPEQRQAKTIGQEAKQGKGGGAGEAKETKFIASDIKSGKITKAEQVLVLNGQKQRAGIIALKVKDNLNSVRNEGLLKALREAYDLHGASYISDGYIVLVFSPLISNISCGIEVYYNL